MSYTRITAMLFYPPDQLWWDDHWTGSFPGQDADDFAVWWVSPAGDAFECVSMRTTALVNLVYFGHPPYDD